MAKESRSRGVTGGIILIGLGVLALLAQFTNGTFLGELWPLIVIGIGLLFFVGMFVRGKGAGGLAVPGSIVTTVGLLLLFQNTFDRWDTWAYAWGLIIAAVGVGIFIGGAWDGNAGSRRSGAILAVVGLGLFVAFGAFFELGLSQFQRFAELFWPVVLIVLGILLILRRNRRSEPPVSGDATPPSTAAIDASSSQKEDAAKL